MDKIIVDSIKTLYSNRGLTFSHPLATIEAIIDSEQRFGFNIPPLLKACYLELGNGGFGPGLGIIGLDGGYESDYGSINECYNALKQDQESEGNIWPSGMLPFCEWGCNIFSCVSCFEKEYHIYTFRDFSLTSQGFNLDHFFEMWIGGSDILITKSVESKRKLINPFIRKSNGADDS